MVIWGPYFWELDIATLIIHLQFKIFDGTWLILSDITVSFYWSLTDEGRRLISLCGSTLINSLKFRDNFIMIGQKGLKTGFAVEKVNCSVHVYILEVSVGVQSFALTIYLSSDLLFSLFRDFLLMNKNEKSILAGRRL